MSAVAYRKITDLPETVSLFPLSGAILFARSNLPLNIFEPRYLNMIDDAMSGNRLIAMIQPKPGEEEGAQPLLSPVGCIGRIVSYSETDDGRYLITLKGICRFSLIQELAAGRPYRQAKVDYTAFVDDLRLPNDDVDDAELRRELLASLKTYLGRTGMQTDWSAVEDASLETLVHALASGCPFSPAEKQLLLEANTTTERCGVLAALFRVSSTEDGGTLQ